MVSVTRSLITDLSIQAVAWNVKEFDMVSRCFEDIRKELNLDEEAALLKQLYLAIEEHNSECCGSVSIVSALCASTVHYSERTDTELRYSRFCECLRIWLALLDGEQLIGSIQLTNDSTLCKSVFEYKPNDRAIKVIIDLIYADKTMLAQGYAIEIISRILITLKLHGKRKFMTVVQKYCRPELWTALQDSAVISDMDSFQKRFNIATGIDLRSYKLSSVEITSFGARGTKSQKLNDDSVLNVDFFHLEIYMEGYSNEELQSLKIPYELIQHVNFSLADRCIQLKFDGVESFTAILDAGPDSKTNPELRLYIANKNQDTGQMNDCKTAIERRMKYIELLESKRRSSIVSSRDANDILLSQYQESPTCINKRVSSDSVNTTMDYLSDIDDQETILKPLVIETTRKVDLKMTAPLIQPAVSKSKKESTPKPKIKAKYGRKQQPANQKEEENPPIILQASDIRNHQVLGKMRAKTTLPVESPNKVALLLTSGKFSDTDNVSFTNALIYSAGSSNEFVDNAKSKTIRSDKEASKSTPYHKEISPVVITTIAKVASAKRASERSKKESLKSVKNMRSSHKGVLTETPAKQGSVSLKYETNTAIFKPLASPGRPKRISVANRKSIVDLSGSEEESEDTGYFSVNLKDTKSSLPVVNPTVAITHDKAWSSSSEDEIRNKTRSSTSSIEDNYQKLSKLNQKSHSKSKQKIKSVDTSTTLMQTFITTKSKYSKYSDGNEYTKEDLSQLSLVKDNDDYSIPIRQRSESEENSKQLKPSSLHYVPSDDDGDDVLEMLVKELYRMQQERVIKKRSKQMAFAELSAMNQIMNYLDEWILQQEAYITPVEDLRKDCASLIKEADELSATIAAAVKKVQDDELIFESEIVNIEAQVKLSISTIENVSFEIKNEFKTLETFLVRRKKQCIETLKSKLLSHSGASKKSTKRTEESQNLSSEILRGSVWNNL